MSLVAKAKAGDYGGGNGWNASVDLGWQGGSHGDSGFSLGLGGDFSTNTDGDLDTNLTRDEFGINANGGGGGNDWFNTNYDSKAHVVSDTVEGHSTYHSEHDSTGHEDSGVVSDSDSSFTFELSKPTGGDVTGAFGFTFEGGSGDNWHVKNNSVGKWKNIFDDGSGRVEIYEGVATDDVTLDEVYTSSYNGNPSANLNADGATASGSSEYEEYYTFDLVTVDDREYSTETTASLSG